MKHLKSFNESQEERLSYDDWVNKFFDKDDDHNYWTSRHEQIVIGFAPSDMSRWREKDLREEYDKYINNTWDEEEEGEHYYDTDWL